MDEQQQPSATDGSGTDALHAECQKQLADFEAKWKRAVADYQNREKELTREREEFAKFCTVGVIRDFLPVVDAIVASGVAEAFRPPPDGDLKVAATSLDYLSGFSSLHRLCLDFLKRHGVEPIGTVGDRVDYLLHEVVGTRTEEGPPSEASAKEGKDAGTILEVAQVGYTMHGRLLRPARVIVAE